jgi:hypothetical protein
MSRHLGRRLLLGSGPLKRGSDRLHALSRLAVLGSVLAAVPVGILVGLLASSFLHGTARAQAAARTERTATLLAAAPVASPDGGDVVARAEWHGSGGQPDLGSVLAPSGAPAGTTVTVWLDARGRITTPPLRGEDITAQSVVAGALTAIALPTLVALLHLLVVHALDRGRLRRWAEEWASVEPQWAGRTY